MADGFAGGTGVVDDHQNVGARLGPSRLRNESESARNHKNRIGQRAQKTPTTHWRDYRGNAEQVWCQRE